MQFHQIFFFQRKSRESRTSRRESILTRSDIKLNDNAHVKAQRPTTATRVKQVEELRDKLFKAVDDNDKSNVSGVVCSLYD